MTEVPLSLDPQRDRFYEAEDYAQEMLYEDPADIAPDELEHFTGGVMERAGWAGRSAPTFLLDVTDDDSHSGWHEGATGIIHLHPRLLDAWTVLHEVSHWLRPTDGHGPQFVGTFLGLLSEGVGEDAREALEDGISEYGIAVDRSWCSCMTAPD